eukprot:gene27383-biopygen10563
MLASGRYFQTIPNQNALRIIRAAGAFIELVAAGPPGSTHRGEKNNIGSQGYVGQLQ